MVHISNYTINISNNNIELQFSNQSSPKKSYDRIEMTCKSTNSRRQNTHGTCLESNHTGFVKCKCNGLEYSSRYKISFDTIKDTFNKTKELDNENIYISKLS